MTEKKPGAVRGRPKGSGAGFVEAVSFRLPPEVVEQVDAAAAEQGTERSVVLREIVIRWAQRRARKEKR